MGRMKRTFVAAGSLMHGNLGIIFSALAQHLAVIGFNG